MEVRPTPLNALEPYSIEPEQPALPALPEHVCKMHATLQYRESKSPPQSVAADPVVVLCVAKLCIV